MATSSAHRSPFLLCRFTAIGAIFLVSVAAQCPPGYTLVDGACFRLATNYLSSNLQGAIYICQSDAPGGDIASIRNEAQLNGAIDLLKNTQYKYAWIGLQLYNGSWLWVDDDARLVDVGYSRWVGTYSGKSCAFLVYTPMEGWCATPCFFDSDAYVPLCKCPAITVPEQGAVFKKLDGAPPHAKATSGLSLLWQATARSRVECALFCRRTTNCNGVNFAAATGVCELLQTGTQLGVEADNATDFYACN